MLNIKKSTIILVFFSFLIGFSYTNIELKLKRYSEILMKNHLKICPNKISNLPFNSTLIIGHAYGSQSQSKLRGDIGIAQKFMIFIFKTNGILIQLYLMVTF